MKKTIRDFDLNNKKVIIRVDFNVPISNGVILDDNRIKESLKTINYAIRNGARVILLSVLNSAMENIYRINQGNTALNVIEFRDYGPVVIKMNDTSHIKVNQKLENSALE